MPHISLVLQCPPMEESTPSVESLDHCPHPQVTNYEGPVHPPSIEAMYLLSPVTTVEAHPVIPETLELVDQRPHPQVTVLMKNLCILHQLNLWLLSLRSLPLKLIL